MVDLTDRQRQVLNYISSFIDEHDYPPTLREISAEIGTSGTVSALRHLEALERKGRISRDVGSARGITLKREPRPELLQIPVVGVVNAGQPVLAFEDIEGYYPFEQVQARGGTFFLRVKGDSMIDDAILDGDLVLVKSQPTASNGDIVVAMVNSEVTLKRFYLEHGHVRLQPRNTRMAPIIVSVTEELVIVGKVIKVLRELD